MTIDSSLTSKEEETIWIKQTVITILQGIRDIMDTDSFKNVMEKLGQNRRQNYIKKLYDGSMKRNLPRFLNSAIIRPEPVQMLTDHVIQQCSNDIMTHFKFSDSHNKPQSG